MYQPVTITKSKMKDDGGFPVYGANGVIGRYDRFNHEEPQLIIGCRGACGAIHITEPKSWITGNSMVIRPDPDRVELGYLHYFFMSSLNLDSVITGAAQPQITRKSLVPVKVKLPPRGDQKRIVAVLDQGFAALDRARAHAEANLADAEGLLTSELRIAYGQEATNGERLSFDQLCETVTPKVKIKRQDYLEEGTYPIVSQEVALVSGYWNDPDALLGIGEPVVVFGDHTRCLKYIDFDFVVGADGTKVLKPKTGVSAAYLYYGLRSQPIVEGGYARHFKLIREKSLPCIPFVEQERLVARLSEIEDRSRRLGELYRAKLSDIGDLRQSLLQQAFSGQL